MSNKELIMVDSSTSKAAGMASILANGLAGYTSGIKERDEAIRLKEDRQLELERHRTQQAIADTQLSNAQLQQEEFKLKLTEAENAQAKQMTYDAFDMYTEDSNPRHLNAILRATPVLKEIYGNVASVDRIDPVNDADLIRQSSLIPDIFTDPNTAADANHRFLKATDINGEKTIIDMMQLFAGTGYTRHISDIKLKDQLTRAQINRYNRLGDSSEVDSGSNDTAMVRNAKAVAEAKQRIADGVPDPGDEELVRFGEQAVSGVTPGKVEYADTATKNMLDTFGGEDQFFSTDFSNPAEYRKAYPYITKIEAGEDIKWTADERKQLGNIKSLLAMGDPAKGLTEADTGLIDSTFNTAKKYIFEEVGDGVKAASAYAAFRNSVRNALFGSALTEAEITNFNEAFGTLGQKTGAVLQQFRTAMVQVKAQLEAISNLQNPYVAKVRLGVDMEHVDDIIGSLEQRIDYLNSKTAIDPSRKEELDAIFKKGGAK